MNPAQNSSHPGASEAAPYSDAGSSAGSAASDAAATHSGVKPPSAAAMRSLGFVLPSDLPAQLMPLAWLIGTWEGVGVAVRQGREYQFGQRLSFTCDGRAFLAYTSQVWELDAQGTPQTPDDQESGFWRPGAQTPELEVVLANAQGYVEVYVGTAQGPRIEMATDMVGRTAQAPGYAAGKRMYGMVEGDLLYAHDAVLNAAGATESAAGQSAALAPLRSARLKRTSYGQEGNVDAAPEFATDTPAQPITDSNTDASAGSNSAATD